MRHPAWSLCIGFLTVICLARVSLAGQAFTWQEIRDKFITANPTCRRLGLASMRPGPRKLRPISGRTRPLRRQRTISILSAPTASLQDAQPSVTFSYLFERMNKRGLRTESARKGTAVAASQMLDVERNLLFALRGAFIQVLQQKAVLTLAGENLTYYDHVLEVSAERLRSGDIARIDLDRLQLQRVQFESDVQSATVSLRTAKIQLLTLLDDRTPVEQFDVAGLSSSPRRFRLSRNSGP